MTVTDPSKPLLFAAMPFGRKDEPGGARAVNFDALYDECIKPAAAAADVEVIRADEETLGGIIHRPMYERLLLAEIVVADLTFANANVFYELGVRHAARPRSTILIYAQIGQLPFDVAPIRAIPYKLDDGGALVAPDALREELAERLEIAKTDEVVDSPLFQLLEDYPGISLAHEVTEAFRDRALWVSDLTIRTNEVVRRGLEKDVARAALQEIEEEARGADSEQQLLITLMLAYPSIEAWGEMVRIAESLPDGFKAVPTIREQLALALSRRNEGDDRNRAIDIINEVIEEHGESPESLGILGRCFKARWMEKEEGGDAGAARRARHGDRRVPARLRGGSARLLPGREPSHAARPARRAGGLRPRAAGCSSRGVRGCAQGRAPLARLLGARDRTRDRRGPGRRGRGTARAERHARHPTRRLDAEDDRGQPRDPDRGASPAG